MFDDGDDGSPTGKSAIESTSLVFRRPVPDGGIGVPGKVEAVDEKERIGIGRDAPPAPESGGGDAQAPVSGIDPAEPDDDAVGSGGNDAACKWEAVDEDEEASAETPAE